MSRRLWPALDIRFPSSGAGQPLKDLLLAALDDWRPTAIDEPDPADFALRAYFPTEGARADAVRGLQDRFASSGVIVQPVDVPDEGWAERSQSALRAVRVGQLTIAPPWDAGDPGDPRRTIIIRPSMGFGTGHHASTRLCLNALQRLEVMGRDVCDVGTGSGVLALAAVRLGANHVTAIDTDPDALAAARENVELNGAGKRIELRLGDFGAQEDAIADVVTANLTAALLTARVRDLIRLATPAGHLILSGFTFEEERLVMSAFAVRTRLIWRGDEDGWAAAILELRAPGAGRRGHGSEAETARIICASCDAVPRPF